MKNTINSPIRKLKLLIILPLIAGVFYAFATPEYKYAQGADQKPAYSITNENIQIPFTNELTKADLEAIKSDLAKVGMTADYTSLEFTTEGKLKEISATVSTRTGSVSFNSKDISPNRFWVFKKEPTGEFSVYLSGVVKGTVVKPGGSPLSGASVVIAGTNVGTVTDENGVFQLIDVPKDAEIVITYVGYDNVKVKPDEAQPLVITMNPVNVDIDLVTVTALDKTPETKTLATSLGSTITVKTNSPLQFGNKNGQQPLIVIDGVITENKNVNTIPPDIIESINVLKGESATNKYGNNGVNGVTEITLKKDQSDYKNIKEFTTIDGHHYTKIGEPIQPQKENKVYTMVEEMPEFPGGDAALRQFIAQHVKYPMAAMEKHIQGKIYVTFVVDKTGKVTDAKIATGVDASLDQEGIRVVQSMPLWKPGTQGGKAVDVQYTIPINFVLEKAPEKVYQNVDQMPEFPGGDAALFKFMSENVRYPATAHEKSIQGKVLVSFVVDKTGKVVDPKIVRGVDPSLDKEAIRVVQLMPLWKPGKQGVGNGANTLNPGKESGENVAVEYTLPINFVLEDNSKKGETVNKQEGDVFLVVEEMPVFPGGDEGLKAFIISNLKYPAIALENGIQGKVFVTFVVSKTGKAKDPKILRGVDSSIDAEALRVIESMPAWTPGKQKGAAVNVSYTLPIEFKLTNDQRNKSVSVVTYDGPEFPGGGEALRTFIAANKKYPPIALANGIEGQIFVSFVVDKTGSIIKAKVTRGVDPSLNTEALRIINSMPKWIPAKRNGENIAEVMSFAIDFKLPADYNSINSNIKKEKLRVAHQIKTKPEGQSARVHELIIVPNPTNDKAVITLKDSDYNSKLEVNVYDKDGKLIRKESKTGPTFTLSFGNLTSGSYFIVANAGNIQFSGQLIVNH